MHKTAWAIQFVPVTRCFAFDFGVAGGWGVAMSGAHVPVLWGQRDKHRLKPGTNANDPVHPLRNLRY
eukprot:1380581-Rhodomonas_salina.1